jgi:hypothetical protein
MTIDFSCSDSRIIFRSSAVHSGFLVYDFAITGVVMNPTGSSPTMGVDPVPFSCSGSVSNPTSDSPSMNLGLLPKGLQLTDNQDGTAFIHGNPAKGTAGTYLIPIKITGTSSQFTEIFRLVITEKNQ